MKMRDVGSVIFSWNFEDPDKPLVIIGDQHYGKKMEIVNAAQGSEALAMFNAIMPNKYKKPDFTKHTGEGPESN